MSGPRSGLVAVLFTDLVGSTELMTQLGERTFDELRRQHFAALGRAVAAHGGEEVKNTGDGLMTVFPSAAEAVEAAVAMQQATARQAKTTSLAIRVGVAVGDATFEAGDYFGTPVVEAARLVAAAQPGQILTTQITRALAGGRCTAALIDLGLLELKGLAEPVGVWEVGWEPAGSPVPMPGLLTGIGRIFVGREAEIERLTQLWKEAATGDRRVALLAGEPGVGKSRLAAELAIRVHDEGAVVLAGRCDEDLGVPYQPFVEALRHFVDHTSPEDLKERLGRYGGELVRLLPELAERVPDLRPPLEADPETERYRLFDAMAAWLSNASAAAPVLVLLDDLHWAAKPTVLLLRHILRSTEPLRLLAIATYRDSDIRRGHPLADLLADLRREGGAERFVLSGLDTSAVTAFIEAAAGHHLDDEEQQELSAVVWRETEGNPFFVTEVLRHLRESRAIEQRQGRWVLTASVDQLGIPEGVRDVVGRRLSHLSELANRVLSVAAVVGLEFEPAVVERADVVPEDELLVALEDAAAARLLSEAPNGRYRFAHGLIRATLYDELSAARRLVLHRRIAQAIEAVHGRRLDEYLPALAHHWARASAPAADTARAVDYATRAADRALVQLAHDEAVAYYRQALELLDVAEGVTDPARRLELLIALGEAQRRAGEPKYRETLLVAARLAEDRGDADALARAALANNRGMLQSSVVQVDHDRVAALEAALSIGVAADSPERARLLANLGLELTASEQRDRRLRLSDEALSMARRLGDASTLTHVLTARFYTLISPDTLATRLADTAELIAVAERLGDPVATAHAHLVRARGNTEHGDVDEARSHLQVAEQIATELGQPTLRWFTTWARAAHLLLAGRLAEAETTALEAGRLGEATSQPDAALFLAGQLVGVRLEQGRLAEVEGSWADVVEHFPDAPLPRTMLAFVLAELDRTAEAQALLDDLAVNNFAGIPVNNVWLWELTTLAVVAARTGDEANSAILLGLLSPHADHIAGVAAIWVGSVSHYLGLLSTTLGRFDQADIHFSGAEVAHERIGAPTWLARTRLEWARMLLIRRQIGDGERARKLLSQALGTARELGLADIERRAVRLVGEMP